MTATNNTDPAEQAKTAGIPAADAELQKTIERFLRLLHEPKEWFELRALDCPDRPGGKYRGTASAYHDNPVMAADDAIQLDKQGAAGVYVTINPVNPDCAARAHQRIVFRPKNTTTDNEILQRRWLPIDLDPERPSGISATAAERAAAEALARGISADLAAAGWPEPLCCSTPNGMHLLYRLDLPNDPESLDLVRRTLDGLAVRFSTQSVKVDRSLINAARILRIPGTTGRKGDDMPERPHRRGDLLDVPVGLLPVARDLLETAATPKIAPRAASTSAAYPAVRSGLVVRGNIEKSEFERFDPSPEGVRAYLEKHGVTVKNVRQKGTDSILDLKECPITGAEGGTSVSVIVAADGKISYPNRHDRGQGLTWHDLREHFEPGYRAYVESMKARNAGVFTPTRSTSDPAGTPGGGVGISAEEPVSWEEPVPLTGAIELPAFPLEALPAYMAGFVRELAASLEVHPDMPAAFALGVGAAACQGKFRVHVRGDHREPLNLFLAVALPPAELKSETIRQTLAPLIVFEKELQERERESVVQAEERHHVDEERKKELRAKAARAKEESEREAARRELEALAMASGELPTLPRLTASGDVLPEVLASLLNKQGGRLTIYDAEGGTLFGNLAGRYQSGNPNFEILLKAHAGDDVQVDRQSKPPILVRRPCLTVILAVQPDVVRCLADTPAFRNRGLAGRFLFSFPPPTAGRRGLDGPPVSDRSRALYGFALRATLLLLPAVDVDGEEIARELKLAPDALVVYRDVATALMAQMREGQELHGIQDWAGKAHGAAARVAGILHVLEHSTHGRDFFNSFNSFHGRLSGEENYFLSSLAASCACGGRPEAVLIPAATVARAWQIITYYKAHALHAYSLMGNNATAEMARRILSWLRETGKKRFTRVECHRRFQSEALKAADLDAPLSLLEDRHYIRREPDNQRPAGHPGRKPTPSYTVNPLWKN